MKPTIGRIVIYKTTEEQRNSWKSHPEKQLAAVVVYAENNLPTINIKVFTNGPFADVWIQSVYQGDEEGQWNWPVIAPAQKEDNPIQGDILIAINPCVMEDTKQATLVVEKEYIVKLDNRASFAVIDERQDEHYFAYTEWTSFFKHK